MKNTTVAIISFGTILALCDRAWGQEHGADLLRFCQATIQFFESPSASTGMGRFNAGYCLGYVNGVSELLIATGGHIETGYGPLNVCVPNEFTNEQFIRVVVKYLEDRPQDLHESALLLTATALADAFPCP